MMYDFRDREKSPLLYTEETMPAKTNAIVYARSKQPITVGKTPFPIRTEVSISSRRRMLKELVTFDRRFIQSIR